MVSCQWSTAPGVLLQCKFGLKTFGSRLTEELVKKGSTFIVHCCCVFPMGCDTRGGSRHVELGSSGHCLPTRDGAEAEPAGKRWGTGWWT